MSEWKPLPLTAQLPDKPFTDPLYSTEDVRVLRFALERLRLLLQDEALIPKLAGGQQLFWVEIDGRIHRLIVCDLAGLRAAGPLVLVGFFGQRRPGGDTELVDQVDTDLISELLTHTGLLSYCSVLLNDGEYANLVLFRDETAKLHWSTSERHAYAARVLSPKYYESVRLHNGCLPGGLFADQPLQLVRTIYLDYRGMLPRRDVREWPPEDQIQ
jgi:hypothetical protein